MFGYTDEWATVPEARAYSAHYWDEDQGRMRSGNSRYPLPSKSYDYLNYISPLDRPLFTSAFPYRTRAFPELEFGDVASTRWRYGTTFGRHPNRSSFSSSLRSPSQTTPSTCTYGVSNDRTLLNHYNPVNLEARRTTSSNYSPTSTPHTLGNSPPRPKHGSTSDYPRVNTAPSIVSCVNDSSSGAPAPEKGTKMAEGTKEANADGKDVMISYSHQDKEAMRNIKKLLESSGMSVWVDETGISPGSSFLKEIGGAVFHSSVFLIVLSLDSAKSRYCRDEISSAYISNKNIFVVALAPFIDLFKAMDVGTRMVLHTLQWHLVSGNVDAKTLTPLVKSIKAALVSTESATKSDHTAKEDGLEEDSTNFIINEQAFLSKINKLMDDESLGLFDKDFWRVKFGKETQIEWTRFVDVLDSSYENLWKQLMITDQQKEQLLHRMSKEMAVATGIVTSRQYNKFCSRGHDELPLSQAIRLYAAETYAMKGVFDVNSTVRMSAITNLRKFQSKAVIDSLLDILEAEEDPDVRVVAAMSLAHAASGIKAGQLKARAENSLMLCLDHPDRLVRESGCLALGRLKSKKSVPKLVQKWRNDVISTVREAAQIAINQIGGDDAEQAMHVTKILSEEISLLKQSPN